MKKRLFCLALCLFLLTSTVFAAGLLEKPANGSVADVAGVLERDTIEHITSQNQKLTDATGAVICVVTVDFLNGKDIGDYAVELFNDWGIGDKDRDNGLLILLAIGEDDYYTLAGDGLKKALPASTLSDYAWNYLENDFAGKDYDAGVHKLFDAYYDWFAGYYAAEMKGGASDPGLSGTVDQPGYSSGGGILKGMGTLITVAVVVMVILVLVVCLDGIRYSRYRRRGFGGIYRPFIFGRPHRTYRRPRQPRPPRPPRSSGGFWSSGSGFGGGHSRGGGVSRSSGFSRSHRSGGSFGGGRSGFGGGRSRGGGVGRRR